MAIPTIEMSMDEALTLVEDPSTASPTVEAIRAALIAYPHCVLFRGPQHPEDRALLWSLSKAIARHHDLPPPERDGPDAKVSFTRVEVNSDEAGKKGQVTRESRSHRPMALHTDSSYSPNPHELIAFQMVRSDDRGGETQLATVEDVTEHLDATTIRTLKRRIFPFGNAFHSAIWDRGGRPNIRYYDRQMEATMAMGAPLSDEARLASSVLDRVLRDVVPKRRFRLAPGEVVFLHNTKVLHGRSGFAETSQRLMFRARTRAPCLG